MIYCPAGRKDRRTESIDVQDAEGAGAGAEAAGEDGLEGPVVQVDVFLFDFFWGVGFWRWVWFWMFDVDINIMEGTPGRAGGKGGSVGITMA